MYRPFILVVDDNKITTKLMRRYLEGSGFDVEEAGDGVECLEKVEIRIPDAIILDIMMPRMDGFETVRALKSKERTRLIPVAIVTALNDLATQLKAVEAGADDFLTKPIEEKLLLTKASIMTELSQARRSIALLTSVVEAYAEGDPNRAQSLLNSNTSLP
ncbi:MAG: response regulator [Candidatus Kapabacteria bacterium]|nr:response regulator [Candidatus Kapabacteria bacterium]